jgi:thiosulfate/3-mercaptopyruvate sulfurtransferase
MDVESWNTAAGRRIPAIIKRTINLFAFSMDYTTLIDTDALSRNLHEPDWIVFDCRFDLADPDAGERNYLKAHIPGARYAHLEHELSSPVRPHTGRHPLPDPERFMRWLGRMGVDQRTQVVAYDASGGAFAARLWWLLGWVGHVRRAVLDGGWLKWWRESRPASAEVPPPQPRRFFGKLDPNCYVSTADVAALVRGRLSGRLIDARDPKRFAGVEEPIDAVAGHVPGAVNVAYRDNLDESGQFRPPARLRARFKHAIEDDGPSAAIHMCGSGVTACHNVLAMAVAGLPGARLYAGSWSEWIRDPVRPVATGSGHDDTV